MKYKGGTEDERNSLQTTLKSVKKKEKFLQLKSNEKKDEE